MISWEAPLVRCQAVHGTSNTCGSSTDKKGFKKQLSFSDLLSMKLAISASSASPAPQASLSLQQNQCFWRPSSAALQPGEGASSSGNPWPGGQAELHKVRHPPSHWMSITTSWPHAQASASKTAAVSQSGFRWGSLTLLPQHARNHQGCYVFPCLPVTGR